MVLDVRSMTGETPGLRGGWQYAGAGRGSLSLILERWREPGAAGGGGAWLWGGRSGGCWHGLGQLEAGTGNGAWGGDLYQDLGFGSGLETVVTGAGSLSLCLGRLREHEVAGGGGAWLRGGGSGSC